MQPQSAETSHKYEAWGPLYIQETGEEQDFTPELKKTSGRDHLLGPTLCPRPLWLKKLSDSNSWL